MKAQTAPESSADEADATAIVVTAQKRTERLQDVPLSIAVQSGVNAENYSLYSIEALQQQVPNLSITDTPANNSIFIRGIGTSGNTLSFEQSVALFVDNIYGGRNRQFNQPLLDVERVEIIRGPAGALFGRNTSAGAISVTSRRPGRELGGYIYADYDATYQSHSIVGALDAPMGEDFAVRAVARQATTRGPLFNTFLNRDDPVREDFQARLSFLWTPAKLKLFGKFEWSQTDQEGQPFEFVPGGTRPDYRVNTDNALFRLGDFSDTKNAVLQADYELGDHTLTGIYGFSGYYYQNAFNIQARQPSRLAPFNTENFDQHSVEVRLLSPTGRKLEYVVGAYFEHSTSDIFRRTLTDLPAPPRINSDTNRSLLQDTDVYAVFGSATWNPVEPLRIIAGGRFTSVTKNATLSRFNVLNEVTRVPLPTITGAFTDNIFEPSATIQYRPWQRAMLYFRYAEGTKGGAFSEFQAVTPATFILAPERARAYEAGAKIDFPAIRGVFNVALFRTDYENLQKSSLEVATATFITENAAGARSQGVEIETSVSPWKGVVLSGAMAYLDAFYTDYPEGPCAFPRNTLLNCSEDRRGDRLQNAPEWTANLDLSVDRPITAGLRGLLNVNARFQDDINFQDVLAPLEEQPAFWRADLRFGVAQIDRKWEVALLIRNITDARTSGLIFNTFPVGIGVNDRVHLPDPVRSYVIQTRLRF